MGDRLLNSLQLKGFLSFGPNSEPVRLTGLNVVIGPNGVGKSNLIEAVELLHATPADFSGAIRMGGLPSDWIWHGGAGSMAARIEAKLSPVNGRSELRYGIEFAESGGRLEIVDEVLEDAAKDSPDKEDVRFYYRFQHGRPAINVVQTSVDEHTGGGRALQGGPDLPRVGVRALCGVASAPVSQSAHRCALAAVGQSWTGAQ